MKTVLVTGASRGIGASTAELFAKNAFRVYLNYNNSFQQAKILQQRLVEQGCDVHLIKADIANSDEVEAAIAHIERYAKRLDVLVNNAGIALYNQIQLTTNQQLDSLVDVNIKGMFFATRAAVRLMLKNSAGSIVNISSVWGVVGSACESLYSMTKSASIGFTLSLDKELSQSGINVNCLCPPLVQTDMCKHLTAEEIAQVYAQIGQMTADEVAQQIFTLATSGKSGQIIKL